MSKKLIIDGNAVGYAAHSMTKLTNGGQEVQAIFGMTKTIRNLRQAFPDSEIVVLWDGKTQWRYDLLPEYKGKRDAKPADAARREAYRQQRPMIAKMLKLVGITQMSVATHEADDMAGYLVKAMKLGNEIVLITGDGDWQQLIGPNVSWYDPRQDGKWVTSSTFTDKTGYLTQHAFLQGKALAGDTSDAIPPAAFRGIGKDTAPVFLAEFGSVEDFFLAVDSGEFEPKKAAHKKVASPEARANFNRNMRLMSLLNVEKPSPSDVKVVRGNFDAEAFKEFCEDLGFISILRGFDTFTAPYRKE